MLWFSLFSEDSGVVLSGGGVVADGEEVPESGVTEEKGDGSVENSELRDSLGWDDESIMTSSEVARFFKVHLGSVRRWTRSGELKGYRLGKRGDWRYLRKDVIAFLQGHGSSLIRE